MTPQEEIEAAWFQIENAFDIEPRSYFEAEAPKNGFGSPLAMAVFYLTKRDTKDKARVDWMETQDCWIGLDTSGFDGAVRPKISAGGIYCTSVREEVDRARLHEHS